MVELLKPGDYIGLYIDNALIHTGVLKERGAMESGRKVYQVLLVKNIFQRNFPEIHFDADIRPVTWEQVQEESSGSRSSCKKASRKWRAIMSRGSSPKKNSTTSLDAYTQAVWQGRSSY